MTIKIKILFVDNLTTTAINKKEIYLKYSTIIKS